VKITFEASVVIRGQHINTSKHHTVVSDMHTDKNWQRKAAGLAVGMVRHHLDTKLSEDAIDRDMRDLIDIIIRNLETQRVFCYENDTLINHIRQQYDAGTTAVVLSLWFDDTV